MDLTRVFDHCTLYISARSPFARRVRIAFGENGVPFEERVFDVLKPEPALLQANPLRRVPVLTLKSGEMLVDSHLILDRFYATGARATATPSGPAGLKAARWSGLSVGFCEKIVEWFLDSLRPSGTSDPDLRVELHEIGQSLFARLEKDLATSGDQPLITGATLCQADIDLATMLTYYSLRVTRDWREEFPRAALYLGRLEKRPAFAATLPPAL